MKYAFLTVTFLTFLPLFSKAQPLNCSYSYGVPPIVREDGLTELVGDIVFTCSGGVPGQKRLSTIRVSLDTNITSKVISGNLTEALLLVNEPGRERPNGPATPLIAGTTAIQGRLISTNTVEFANVPYIVEPLPLTVRIVNIRADATRMPRMVDLRDDRNNIYARVSSDDLSIPQTSLLVAQSFGATVKTTVPSGRLDGCVTQNPSLLTNPAAVGSMSFTVDLAAIRGFLKKTEAFVQNYPGPRYNTESGFFDPSLGGAFRDIGFATQGTRVLLALRNIPTGISVFVTTKTMGRSVLTTEGVLISGGPYDSGPYQLLDPVGSATIEGQTVGIRQVPVVNGTAQALWEFLDAELDGISPKRVGVVFAYQAPKTGTVDIDLNFAPLAPPAGTSSAFPRFVANTSKQTISLMGCNDRDLSISAIDVSNVTTIENPTRQAAFAITNQGVQTESSTVGVAVFEDGNGSNKIADITTCHIPSLAPGASQTCMVNLPSLPEAKYYVGASVDPHGDIPEANESNNRVSAELHYKPCSPIFSFAIGHIHTLGCPQTLVALTPNVSLQLVALYEYSAAYAYTLTDPNSIALIKSVESGGIVALGPPGQPHSIQVSPSRSTQDEVKFVASYKHANQLEIYSILVSSSRSPQNSCLAEYDKTTGLFRLRDDAGEQWLGPIPAGQSVANSQCRLQGTVVFVDPQGTIIDVTFALEFMERFAGEKKVYLLGRNQADTVNTGWQEHGTAFIPGPRAPGLRELLPRNGAEQSSTFHSSFKHARGNTGHYLSYTLFLPVPNVVNYTATGSCLVEYNRINNSVRLVNDAGTDWLGPVAITYNAPPLSNQRCIVDVKGVVPTFGYHGELSIGIPVIFKAAMGPKIATFLQALDMKGIWTGMTQYGNWNLPGSPATRMGPYVVDTGVARNGKTTMVHAVVAHTAGVKSLSMVHLRISRTILGSDAWCHAVYFPASNTFNLINDAGTALVHPSGVNPGSEAVLSNNVCALPMSQATVAEGETLTVGFPVMRTSQLLPVQTSAWVNAFDTGGLLSHWSATPDVFLP